MRMFIHILIGLTKEDKNSLIHNDYIRLLGFDKLGQKYVNSIKKDTRLPIITKMTSIDSKIKDYEQIAANVYQILTNEDVLTFEYRNKPITKE